MTTTPAPHGLIIGKFMPPHAGHDWLIHSAQCRVEDLTVLVMARPSDPIPGRLRVAWLVQQHPEVGFVEVAHDLPVDFGSDAVWQRWMALIARHISRPVDVVFSSEAYGDALARGLGARHHCVDLERRRVPVSATDILRDPDQKSHYLAPPVRAWIRENLPLGSRTEKT